jgi:hypothetical protein
MKRLLPRMLGAALLDPETYEEVEADRGATRDAFVVVLLSALGAGVGSIENGGAAGIAWSAVAALVGWWVWAYITYWIGTRLLPGPHTSADHGELLRTLGFSSSPGTLGVLGVVPGLAGPLFLVAGVWMLVSMVVAVRHALDYQGTGRAVAVCALGFPVYAITLVASLVVVGPWPV